jgi:hypothetical protein
MRDKEMVRASRNILYLDVLALAGLQRVKRIAVAAELTGRRGSRHG